MTQGWTQFAIAVVLAVIIAVAFLVVLTLVIKIPFRAYEWPNDLASHIRRPLRTVVITAAIWIAGAVAFPRDGGWWSGVNEVMLVLTVGAGAWFLISLITFVTDIALGRHRGEIPNTADARRIRTQGLILERLAVALVVVVAVGAILMSFPAVRTVGASLLASAGIVSVIAGLAAQSALANMFAGVQLVFSQALRVDDVIVVEGEWGRVGEITLSYVVLNIWDERRLVLPCTYFTTKPFETWTRKSNDILGSVELDLDWRVSVDALRDRFREILEGSDLWDGRTAVTQVTDATGGLVRVRLLMSAADSGRLWDLRCLVRERLVAYVRSNLPEALPISRVLVGKGLSAHTEDAEVSRTNEGLFSGSAAAEQRHNELTQRIPVVTDESESDDR